MRKYLFKKNLSIPEIAHNLKIFKLRQQGGKRGGSGAVSDKESEEFHYAVTQLEKFPQNREYKGFTKKHNDVRPADSAAERL